MSDPVRLRVQFVRSEIDAADLDVGEPAEPDEAAEPAEPAEPEESFDHEDVLGTPTDDEGTYRLVSSSFFVPLAAGDLVRAEPRPDGVLQLVDDVEPCDAVLTIFAPDATASPEAVAGLMRVWEATGAQQSERGGPFVATVWPDMPMDAVAAQPNADQAAGRGEWILASEPDERRREHQDEIDFGVG